MANLSFTSQGATPGMSAGMDTPFNTATQPLTSSPAANALNAAQNVPTPTPPSTPVKRTTVTNPDGSSTSTEYHAPATSPQPTTQQYNPGGGPTDTVYNNGIGTSYQNGQPVSGYMPASPTTPQNTSSTAAPTFAGLIGSLANTSQTGSQNATQATTGLLNAPSQNATLGQNSVNTGNEYANDIKSAISPYVKLSAGQATTGTTPVAQGRSLATLNAANELGTQLTNAGNLALTGNSQAITAQGQGQSGLESAGSVANTQQSNEQSGLQQAGSLTQPTSNFPFKFDPLTGSFSNAATGAGVGKLTYNLTQDAATLATEVINGNIPYSEAVTAMGYAPNNVGTGALQQAIVAAGGNIASLEGQAAGQQAVGAAGGTANAQNIVTGGTAAVNAGASTYAQANPAYLNLKENIIPNIDNFGKLLTQGAGGVNPFATQYGNMTLQQFQSQLSSPQQAAFNATFQQLQKSIAALAGAGGTQTPTANSAQSDATLSPTSKMSTIESTLNRIAQEGNVYLTNQGNLSNAALNQAQGGGGSNSSTSGFGWNG